MVESTKPGFAKSALMLTKKVVVIENPQKRVGISNLLKTKDRVNATAYPTAMPLHLHLL